MRKRQNLCARKRELVINFNQVLLNKVLVVAFRSKCKDNGPSGSTGTQQGEFSILLSRTTVVNGRIENQMDAYNSVLDENSITSA